MNELQKRIFDASLELSVATDRVANAIGHIHNQSLITEQRQTESARERAKYVAAGIEGKNAEERQANLTLLTQETDNKLRNAQLELDGVKYEHSIAVLRHQEARYILKASIAIAEARDEETR